LPAQQAEPAPLPGRKHLRRLGRIFETIPGPIYYITCCVRNRRPILVHPEIAKVLISAWETSPDVYGWRVGKYVVMPDHVHFFAAACKEDAKTLSGFIGSWKRWTKRNIHAAGAATLEWQAEFFDHVLRSGESYAETWDYVSANPVRAGLVARPEEWPFLGELNVLEW
jgi:REP element-mobilizing transposase RayT